MRTPTSTPATRQQTSWKLQEHKLAIMREQTTIPNIMFGLALWMIMVTTMLGVKHLWHGVRIKQAFPPAWFQEFPERLVVWTFLRRMKHGKMLVLRRKKGILSIFIQNPAVVITSGLLRMFPVDRFLPLREIVLTELQNGVILWEILPLLGMGVRNM